MVINNDSEFNQILLFAHPGKDFSLFTNKNTVNLNNFLFPDLLQSEFVAGYHRTMVTRRKIVERLKRPKWVHSQNRKRVDLRSKLHCLWGTQQPKKLLCVWIWSIVACVVMYYTFYTFYTLCKSSSAACSHAPSSCSPRHGFWPTYRWFPRGGGATKRRTTGKRDSQKQEKENKTHH